jgi:hypothetical protein
VPSLLVRKQRSCSIGRRPHPRPTQTYFEGRQSRMGYYRNGPRGRMTSQERRERDYYERLEVDPSLVRIVTTTPPPLLRPYRPRSALAEASSSAQESAPVSKPRSHPRSHLWAAARRRRLGPREPAHVACVLLRCTLRLRLRRSPDGPRRLELGRPCRPRARRAGHRGGSSVTAPLPVTWQATITAYSPRSAGRVARGLQQLSTGDAPPGAVHCATHRGRRRGPRVRRCP